MSNGAALLVTLAILVVVALAVASTGGVTCEPPRRTVAVGGRHECVQTVTLPDGRLAIIEPNPTPAAARKP